MWNELLGLSFIPPKHIHIAHRPQLLYKLESAFDSWELFAAHSDITLVLASKNTSKVHLWSPFRIFYTGTKNAK